VTWCIGHLVEAVPPEGYDASATSAGPSSNCPSFPSVAGRGQGEDRHAIQGRQSSFVAKATELVIATDADREGE
jgi:DNA topoisomerase-3